MVCAFVSLTLEGCPLRDVSVITLMDHGLGNSAHRVDAPGGYLELGA